MFESTIPAIPSEFKQMLKKKEFDVKGTDAPNGVETYVNPNAERGYHLDSAHLPLPKGPHVGVHRPRGKIRVKASRIFNGLKYDVFSRNKKYR